MKKIIAIYVIVNKVNHKVYLGSTNDFKYRRNRHFRTLRNRKHQNKYLQSAWNKYGEESFVIFSIEEFEKISDNARVKREAAYIRGLNSADRRFGYNLDKNPADKSGKNNPSYGKRGKDAPNWRGGPPVIECACCNRKFKRSGKHINKNKKRGCKNYCSRKCIGKSTKTKKETLRKWLGLNPCSI